MRFASLLAALVALPLFAAGPGEAPAPTPTQEAEAPAEWPQKGDTVYLSAPLAGFNPMTIGVAGLVTKMPDVPTLDPCMPMTVRGVTSDKIRCRDDQGHDRKLVGPEWTTRLHSSQNVCRAEIEKSGLPRVKSTGGYLYSLIQTRDEH